MAISVGLFGMFVGAAASEVLSDRYGREAILLATMLVYSIATGLTALVWGYEALLVLRFVTGLGLGGELPVASTLVAEVAPARQRGRMLVLLESFWAYGWILAAIIGYLVIPDYGWRIAFVLVALPAFYVLILRRYLAESPRNLPRRGRNEEARQVAATLGVTASSAEGAELDAVGDRSGGRGLGLKELWSATYARRTAMLWVLWFGGWSSRTMASLRGCRRYSPPQRGTISCAPSSSCCS
jgi:putative MFS transporter